MKVSIEWGERVVASKLMIEGSVWLCRNSALLSKNTDAFAVIALTLSTVMPGPRMYQLRAKQLFPVNISRWCRGLDETITN